MTAVAGKEKPITYFAYGSNLYSPRLRYRVSSCKVVGTASLPKHTLLFHKGSVDGSAKCDASPTGNGTVLGVLYEIDADQLDDLRDAEGARGKKPGYIETQVDVVLADGRSVSAYTYIAAPTHIVVDTLPYSWYRDFVLMGCAEHQLPADYVDTFVRAIDAKADPNHNRDLTKRLEVVGNPVRPSDLAT